VASDDLPGSHLLGVGLGVPGIADARAGVVDSPVLGWNRVPLGPMAHERIGVPVLLDNDVNTLAGAERLYGRGRGVENFVTVTIGRGVGLGIVVGGELYRGAHGGAGEFGHVRVVDDGPLCHCGHRGCLEALVSDIALVDAARRSGQLGADAGIDRLRDLAESGSEAARGLFASAGTTLGHAVAGLVNILSPQLVLVSGEGTQAWQWLSVAFEAALREDIFMPLRVVPVEVDPWDDTKWARGAVALVLRATFSTPIYEFEPDDAVRARLEARTEARAVGDGLVRAGGSV
jgi:predicted NBD/HSP70 family sugar kinase